MLLFIPVTKTNSNGVTVEIAKQPAANKFCAWRFLVLWLKVVGTDDPTAPLFQRVSAGRPTGQPCSKDMFIRRMRALIASGCPGDTPMDYAGHSLRIASATFMAALNISRPVAKSIGGWLSECMDIYIHTSSQQKMNVCIQLGSLFN